MLRDCEKALPACVKLAYLPRPGIVRLRLSVVDNCASEAEQILEVIIGKLLGIIPQHIFGYDDITLEESLGELLRERRLTLASAESCTGGNIARMITSVPGSSSYYSGSVIAYENRIKTEVLGVDPVLIGKEGAVCREVVEQMASGVRELLGTHTSISTSGIAGPDGGSDEKPVGTTWICVQYGDESFAKQFRFGGSRERIIDQASNAALQLLRRLLLKNL
jgi:nicotinamide-nucleotide amidase